jgi:hypothetical protein
MKIFKLNNFLYLEQKLFAFLLTLLAHIAISIIGDQVSFINFFTIDGIGNYLWIFIYLTSYYYFISIKISNNYSSVSYIDRIINEGSNLISNIGLLGTIAGMMSSIKALTHINLQTANIMDEVSKSGLDSALSTTLVAFLSVIFLRARYNKIILKIELRNQDSLIITNNDVPRETFGVNHE